MGLRYLWGRQALMGSAVTYGAHVGQQRSPCVVPFLCRVTRVVCHVCRVSRVSCVMCCVTCACGLPRVPVSRVSVAHVCRRVMSPGHTYVLMSYVCPRVALCHVCHVCPRRVAVSCVLRVFLCCVPCVLFMSRVFCSCVTCVPVSCHVCVNCAFGMSLSCVVFSRHVCHVLLCSATCMAERVHVCCCGT